MKRGKSFCEVLHRIWPNVVVRIRHLSERNAPSHRTTFAMAAAEEERCKGGVKRRLLLLLEEWGVAWHLQNDEGIEHISKYFRSISITYEEGQPVAEDGRVGQVVEGDGRLEQRRVRDQGAEIDLAVALALEVDDAREVGGGRGQHAADGRHRPRQHGERAEAA